VFNRVVRTSFILLFLLIGGCATSDFVTHYGIFEAENSSGEPRLFRVYWQTVRYEGWSKNEFRAFPLVLETQCSQRELRFYDSSFGLGRRCLDAPKEGIHACGNAQQDQNRRGGQLEDRTLCAVVPDRKGSTDLLSLEGEILITLDCRPAIAERRVGGEFENVDYLMGSSIPYIVSTKIVKGQDVDNILPEVSQHSSICDPDY
jgi:hypothetical protein